MRQWMQVPRRARIGKRSPRPPLIQEREQRLVVANFKPKEFTSHLPRIERLFCKAAHPYLSFRTVSTLQQFPIGRGDKGPSRHYGLKFEGNRDVEVMCHEVLVLSCHFKMLVSSCQR